MAPTRYSLGFGDAAEDLSRARVTPEGLAGRRDQPPLVVGQVAGLAVLDARLLEQVVVVPGPADAVSAKVRTTQPCTASQVPGSCSVQRSAVQENVHVREPAAVALHDRAHRDTALAQHPLEALKSVDRVDDVLRSHRQGEHLLWPGHLDGSSRLNNVYVDAVGTVEPSALHLLIGGAVGQHHGGPRGTPSRATPPRRPVARSVVACV